MTRITDDERAALESLERLYGLALEFVERYEIEEDVVSLKQTGRYSTGTWKLKDILDRTDEVLERARVRS